MSFSFFRSAASSLILGTRTLASSAAAVGTKPVPLPKPNLGTPQEFLSAIGRSCETKLTMESWPEFWRSAGPDFKKAGVAVRDRRYILWCMSKYRQGVPIEEFAHELKPKKTIRGWGPKVQNGKRIRSRRLQEKH